MNDAIISLNWGIGKRLSAEFTGDNKPEYGKKVVAEVSKRLEQEYGSGFDKTSISRMIKFYQEFPDFEKVATLSQQLTWSHFVEILPINDELKRDFYAAMCMQENWSVRTLRERKKSMLYERTAISKKPEETIKNEIAELRDDGKMSLDLFYRDPYMLDFLGLRDTYSEKDLENIFDRYYRGTNTGEAHKGSGLGMSIAKEIVNAHNGDITISSILGKGTDINITL